MSYITLKYSEIPAYLHRGDLYRSFSADDSELEISADCFHPDGKGAKDLSEFCLLLRVMMFWVLDQIPYGARIFCLNHDISLWDAVASEILGAGSTIYSSLETIFRNPKECSLTDAVNTERLELLPCWASYINRGSELGQSAMREAAVIGDVRVLQFLHRFEFEWDEGTCEECAENGHLSCLAYAHENGCPWNATTYYVAAAHGHLECLQYACNNGLERDAQVCLSAALHGQYDVLKYVHQQGFPWDERTLSGAVDGGHLDCLIYAHEQGLEWSASTCMYAADGGHLPCLMYLYEHGCPWDAETTGRAAKMGHVNCLKYALQRACPIHIHACSGAAAGNHLQCLQLLHQYGAPWDAVVCREAARYGARQCLEYLYRNGCAWDEDTPEYALFDDHTDVMQYALDNGCPAGEKLVYFAAENADLRCLQYLVERQLLYMDEDGSVFLVALLKGNIECVVFLLDSGCPFMDAYFGGEEVWDSYDKYRNKEHGMFLSCILFAQERGWLLNQNLIDYVISRNISECIEYMNEERWIVVLE